MAKAITLKIAGLLTAPNDYTAPAGSLDVADDIVIDEPDLAESRRGFETLIDNSDQGLDGFPLQQFTSTKLNTSTFNLLTYRFNSNSLIAKLLLNDRNTITGNNTFLPPPTAVRVRMLNWGNYVYVTSADGIQRYSVPMNTCVYSGIPQGLDMNLSLSGSSGFMTTNDTASLTATVTASSPNLTIISNDDIGSFSVGQTITGTGIPDATTVQSIAPSAAVVIYNTTLTTGSTTFVTTSSAGIVVGQLLSGTGIQTNTRVVSVTGSMTTWTVTMTNGAIIGATEDVTFSSDNVVTMSKNATAGSPTAETITLSNGSQVAYRLVWGYQNENSATMLGAPTPFTAIVNNTGHSTNVQVITTIPAEISTNNFYQLYRSVQTPSSNIVPPDQMQLVQQRVPTDTDISNGYLTLLDDTPDSLKGASLYTGSDQEGITQANYKPPVATDMCTFNGYTLYGNYTQPNILDLTLDGVGAPSGFQVNDVLTFNDTINSFSLTGGLIENTSTGVFEIVTGGTPSQNIADTTNSLLRVMNRYPNNEMVYGYLISGPNDLPGQIYAEARNGIGQFTAVASAHGDAWTPDISTPQASTAESRQNAVIISKVQEPEAVPRLNYLLVGGISTQVYRLIPLRDYTIIIASDGVYRLTGQSFSNFTISPFDLTIQVVAPETAVALGNECWVLATVGAISISDGGARLRSGLQINDVLQQLIRGAPNSLKQYGFAVAYESDQRFIMALPNNEGDTVALQEFCYNYITEKWTRWTRDCTAGYVNKQTGLYLGNGNNANLVHERRNGNFTDYADESFSVTLTAFTDFEVTLDSLTGITVGDLLWQNQDTIIVYSEIVAIDFAAFTVTVADIIDWETNTDLGDTKIYIAIENVIQWKPVFLGDPTEAKQCSEGQFAFRMAKFNTANAAFATDISPAFSSTALLGQAAALWGQFPWGQAPWGGVLRPKTLRFYVPQDQQYCGVLIPKLTIRSGYAQWKLEGAVIVVEDVGFELGGPNG